MLEKGFFKVKTVAFFLGIASAVFVSNAAVQSVGMASLPASTNITVASGDTLRIEYLHGGTTLYKSGGGRLEVAVIGNTNLNIVVSNGTFATSRPTSLDFSEDGNVIFHLDANKASTLTTHIGAGGTNFVTGVADADGRTDRALSTLSGRPDAFLVQDAINGLPAIDLGSLHNSASNGYGAALAFDVAIANSYELLYVFEDDPNAKYRAKSIGPCFFGSAGTASLVRGYVEDGTPAPMHYASIGGRLQDGNYIDGVKHGTAKFNDVPSFYSWPVPDGPHIYRWKMANKSTTPYTPFDAIAGLGYSSKSTLLSYGGLKIGEIIFLNETGGGNDTLDADTFIAPYQTYLMRKWLLPVTTVNKVTLFGDSVLDVSAAPLNAQINHSGYTSSLIGGTNLYPSGYYEAGNPLVSVSGPYTVPAAQSQLPGLEFNGDASLCVAGETKIARIEGTGTLVKTGGGTLTIGASGTNLTALSVQEGTLRIAPLESSGSYLHIDPSAENTRTLSAENGTNFITKIVDVEHGANYLQNTTVKYNFDTTRTIGKPYISAMTQNGLPLIDYGEYTTELYPNGNGSAFVPNVSITTTGIYGPGMRNLFVVWGDYEGVKDLPYNGGTAPLRGPALFGAGSGWGYRGNGGGGESFSIFNSDANGTYNIGGNFKVDDVTVAINHRPSDGMHLLDQRIYNPGAENKGSAVDYIGGCRWLPAYVGGSGSATCGVWGGLRMGEFLIYRQLLPEYFRARVSAALRRKWFNATNTVQYASVSVADGATLVLPDTRLAATSLAIGGSITAEQVSATVISVVSDAMVAGRLAIPDGATISFTCGNGIAIPELAASELSAVGQIGLSFAFDESRIKSYVGAHRVISGTSVEIESATLTKPVLSANARQSGMTAYAEKRSDGIYCTFKISGLMLSIK